MQTPDDTKWPSNAELQKLCITLAKDYPQREWLSEVSNIPLQQSIADLGVAFKNFFEKRAKFPQFKKKAFEQSARFRRGGFSIQQSKVFLAKIGTIKTKWSRPLPSIPSSVTVIKDKANRYFVSFVVEAEPKTEKSADDSVGVDLGIKTFAVLSTGEKIQGPDYTDINRKIKRAQRVVSRRKKRSNRRELARIRLAKLQSKKAAIRSDFLHKLSTYLVKRFKVICIEDLNVSGMLKNRKLARAIGEQGWRMFRSLCESKAAMYPDREVVIINRWEPTSQYCSDCGYQWGKLDLSIREIRCLSCGTVQDRDGNAAKNIKAVGHAARRGVSVRPHNGAVCAEASNHVVEEQLCLNI